MMMRMPVAVIVGGLILILLLGMIDNIFFGRGQSASPPMQPIYTPQGSSLGAQPAPANQPIPGPGSQPGPGQAVPHQAGPPQPLADGSAETRAKLLEGAKRATEAVLYIEQALQSAETWHEHIVSLRDNDEGGLVAADEELAREMAHLFGEKRTPKEELKVMHVRLQALGEEADRLVTADPATPLPTKKVTEIRDLHKSARDAREQWTNAVNRAQAIAREAKRRQPPLPAESTAARTSPPAEPGPTATDATTGVSGQPAAPPEPTTEEPEQPLEPVSPPTQESAETKRESLGAAMQRIKDQEDIKAVENEMAREKDRKEAEERDWRKKEAADRERAAREAELREEAHSAEVQRVLQPFLTRRNLQPRLAGSSLRLYKTFEEQPMSLGALEGVGALHKSVQGLSMLARIGSHRELGSPHWDYSSSPRTWSTDTERKLKEAQDLLRRLGPTMVSEGLLSP